MFDFIAKLFKRKPKLKQINTSSNGQITVTNTDIHPTVAKIKKEEELTLTDINLLLSDFFDTKSLEGKYHKFHKVLVEEAVFEVSRLNWYDVQDKSFISIELTEALFGIKMSIQLPPDQFHQVFKHHAVGSFKEKQSENRNS